MKRGSTIIIPVAICIALSSCQQSQLQSGEPKRSSLQSDEPSKDTQEPVPDSEKVDPPNNISGSYLHCAFEQEATDANPEAMLGCRLDNAQGQRVPAQSLGTSYLYTYRPLDDNRLTVFAKNLANDNRYDAVYLFFGPDRQTVMEGARRATVYLRIEQSVATGAAVLLGDQVRDIERNASTLPEPRGTDYSDVRDAILIDAQNGQVTPPFGQ